MDVRLDLPEPRPIARMELRLEAHFGEYLRAYRVERSDDGVAWTAMHSSIQTWATEVVPKARATMISLFATALFAGSAAAAGAVAGLAEAGAYGTIFLIAAATTVPLGLLATVGRFRWREPGTSPGHAG